MICIGDGVGEFVAHRIKQKYDPEKHTTLGWMKDGKVVAGVLYEGYTQAAIMAHIASDSSITRGFLFAIFDYPFRQLGVGKIIAPVYSWNEDAVRLVQRFGMNEECRIRDAHPGGDLVFFSIRRDECRWLGEKYGRRI